MDQLGLFGRLAGQFNSLSVFLQRYGTYVTVIGFVIALLNCFMGYRLRRLWNVIAGFLAGAAAGTFLCQHFQIPQNWILPASAAAGIVCAFLAYLLYRVGLFILCCGLTVFFLLQLLPSSSTAALAVYLVIGAAVGGLAIAKERVTVSLVTAIGGGFGASILFLSLTGRGSSLLTILLAAVLAFLGILVQLKPWKNHGYWDQEDENLKQERRDNAKARSQRRRSRRKQRKADRKSRKKAQRKSRTNDSARTAGNQRRPAKSSSSANMPNAGSSAPARQTSPSKDTPGSGAADPSSAPSAPQQKEPENSGPKSFDDIRLQLSREVSEIYAEKQNAAAKPHTADTPENQDASKKS